MLAINFDEQISEALLGQFCNQDGHNYCDVYDEGKLSDAAIDILAEQYDNNSDLWRQYHVCTAEYFEQCVENGSARPK